MRIARERKRQRQRDLGFHNSIIDLPSPLIKLIAQTRGYKFWQHQIKSTKKKHDFAVWNAPEESSPLHELAGKLLNGRNTHPMSPEKGVKAGLWV